MVILSVILELNEFYNSFVGFLLVLMFSSFVDLVIILVSDEFRFFIKEKVSKCLAVFNYPNAAVPIS